MSDQKYLEQRRMGWYCVVEVPRTKQKHLGRRLRQSLKTRSLAEAQKRRWAVVAEFKQIIAEAGVLPKDRTVIERALQWRADLEAARLQDADGGSLEIGEGVEEQLLYALGLEAEELSDKGREQDASMLYGIGSGHIVPLTLYLERWLHEGGQKGAFKERTKVEHRRALREFEGWLVKQGLPATLQYIDRSVAGRYVSQSLHEAGRAPATIQKAISSLASYWNWLRKRGHVAETALNPWAEQAPSKAASAPRDEERAFSKDEVDKLISGAPGETLRDFMTVAALTGMRREEIGRLRVADCADAFFVIQQGKTKAARRRVPIHSGLKSLVARRLDGKPKDAFLFHELIETRGRRTDAIGKQFGRLQKDLGVLDKREGVRRSLLNFHSFRRFFTTEAINAGAPPHLVSLLVGHEEGRKGMTLTRYWSGAEDAALLRVVESVSI